MKVCEWLYGMAWQMIKHETEMMIIILISKVLNGKLIPPMRDGLDKFRINPNTSQKLISDTDLRLSHHVVSHDFFCRAAIITLTS